MSITLSRIQYKYLNARQKENYNYQKLAAVLADYGFVTMRLSSDWRGADLIAQHIDGDTFLKIQLKGRLTFCQKYIGKGLHIAFPYRGGWYLYPHDELSEKVHALTKFKSNLCWTESGTYSFASLTKPLFQLLNSYQIELTRRQMKLKLQD
jgi:hypothetical protein